MQKETKTPAVNEPSRSVSRTSVGVDSIVANQQNTNQPPTRSVGQTLANMDGTVPSKRRTMRMDCVQY